MATESSQTTLVIVESPTKARTITKFLGKGYIVKASMGHIRDLPNNASEVPAKYKKEPWARLGVNIEADFSPLYVIPAEKKANVKALRDAMEQASQIYFATDEDREGESISWHLWASLKPKVPVRRLVFHEITREAIQQAIDSTREIDQNLVGAQETRRIVDRLFGYEVSPLLWKKMLPRLSAGRVQSVAVRLLVGRERERIRFKKAAYWGMKASFAKRTPDAVAFEAELTHLGDRRVATGKDFDPETGKLKTPDKVVLLGAQEATKLRADVEGAAATVESVEETPYSTEPPAPFVTSTLQQEANRQLRFSAQHTMRVAQQLYENGFITYMRTDSTTLSNEALAAARSLIEKEFGNEYLPAKPRQYQTKVRNAQEAHEAIRPAGETFQSPETVRAQLGVEASKLYEMIWVRAVASQMENARGTNSNVTVRSGEARFRASGKTVEFAGFMRAQVHRAANPEAELAAKQKLLPKLTEGGPLDTRGVEALERSTQPPPRYSEGTLIKELERLGIGRPSTWATIVETVMNRSYAFKKGTTLVPTFIAIGVVGLLEKHFSHLLDYAFTARLEDDLDAISRGEADRLDYLRSFYFGNGHRGLKALVEQGESSIDPRVVCSVPIGKNGSDREIEVRIGRYGPFITDGTNRASLPDLIAPDEMTVEKAAELLEIARKEPESLGNDPETGLPVYLKSGRFGPYVQLGQGGEGEKPKMASLLANTKPEDVDLQHALALLSLPREVGKHPETNEPVLAANGRFGPYVKSSDEIRSLPIDVASPLEVTLEQAVELLKQPKGRRRAAPAAPLREMGKHPVTERPLMIKSGRFGPYVTDGELNASLRRGMTPENLTMDDAVNLLEARASRIAEGDGKKPVRKRAARKAKKKATKKASKKSA